MVHQLCGQSSRPSSIYLGDVDDEEELLSIMSKRLVKDKSDSTAVYAAIDPRTLFDAVDASDAAQFDQLEEKKGSARRKARISMTSLAISLKGSEG